LLEHKDKKLTVFVIWEPVLGSDIGPPSDENLARVNDPRVKQFWDPELLVSDQFMAMAKAHPEKIPDEYKKELAKRDLIWDAVLVFNPGVRWDAELPYPDYSGGPVVDITEPFSQHLKTITP
jgi:hypothetical protein